MKWIKSIEELPPQGLQVLCFSKGDCWVAYRYNYKKESIWLPTIPHLKILTPDAKPHLCEAPEFWSYIAFSELPTARLYDGHVYAKLRQKDILTIDKLEEEDVEAHQDLIELFIGLRKFNAI